MQTQADKFLEILSIIGPAGYYARTTKEKEIMSTLEKKHLIRRKPGTKRVYILNTDQSNDIKLDKTSFKSQLEQKFNQARTSVRPFVPINELREEMLKYGFLTEIFDSYLIEMYDNNELELEKSFTADDGLKSGLNYKNKKFYSYITQIN